jgi:hypothetical protein
VPVLQVEETSAAVLADRLTADLDNNAALLRWLMIDTYGAIGTGVELPAWRRRAACAGMPVETFVPEGVKGRAPDYRQALETCERCPVTVECAADAYAVEGDGPYAFGVWGGLTPKARAVAHRDDRAAA